MKMNWKQLELPLIPKISFKKVFDAWELWAADANHPRQQEAINLLKEIGGIKALREPFEDLEILVKYKEEIDSLLSNLFPEVLQKNEIKAASLPFQPFFFNSTERFQNIVENAGDGYEISMRGITEDYYYFAAASFYLAVGLGVPLDLSRPQIFDIPDNRNGIVRTYRGFFNADFSEFHRTKDSPELTTEQIAQLLNNSEDLDLWKNLIPPRSFEFHGFGLLTMFDITNDQALSDVKEQLISREALSGNAQIGTLETSLSRYLNVGDLRVGLSVIRDDQLMSPPEERYRSILLQDHEKISCENALCAGSREHLIESRSPIIVSDTEDLKVHEGSAISEGMRERGIRSFVLIPLEYNGRIIGLIELRSATPRVLNSVSENKMREITPLFATAMNRAIEEFETRIQAVIKEKCTAVHPAVEWRFFDAASELLLKNENYHEADMEPIVFERVFPLFGQMDIKGSSKFRDRSIQSDLISQLELIKDVFEDAYQEQQLVKYEQLTYEVEGHLERLCDRLDAGEEPMIMSFLHNEIAPVFRHFRELGIARERLKMYDEQIDDRLKVIYKERKLYEETVATINEHIGSFIEGAQRHAQQIYPHYFEKYKTDGVEYNMYIGQSLVKDKPFSSLYLQNLRLWQLVVTCEAENLIHRVKDSFGVPLEVASLLMVQDTPLDIKFRMDEKRFDVDGAYNARYEIIKKRIDKAKIKGTSERLTQPGKIAIVFSSAAERREYEKYISYLIKRKYITENVEFLELEELPGASGLQAMRIEVDLASDQLDLNLANKVNEIMKEAVAR